jgi:hypothetical protein
MEGFAAMEPEELAGAIKRLTDWAARHAPEPEAEPRLRLREHFDADPLELAVVSRPLQAWDRPNFQLAIDAFLAGATAELLGIPLPEGLALGLTELARGGGIFGSAIVIGEPERVAVPLGEGESVTAGGCSSCAHAISTTTRARR